MKPQTGPKCSALNALLYRLLVGILYGYSAAPGALAGQPSTEPPVESAASTNSSATRPSATRLTASQPDAPEDLAAILEPIRAKFNLPALGGAIISHGRLVAIGAVGVRASDSDQKVTVADRWHLGSCTKAMTATLIAMLIEQGKLRWDTTIADVFPELRDKLHTDYRTVTLEQLLTHRSGAPADLTADGLWGRLRAFQGTPTEARLALLEGVVTKPPHNPPGTKFEYANAGYAIAGAMAERVTGTPWETLIQQMLFEPLGMKEAGFGAPGTADAVDQPRGHIGAGPDLRAVRPGPWADNPAAIGPAGIVNAGLADWAKFVALHVSGERASAPGPHLLKPETMKRLHQPAEGQTYACGWVAAERPWGGHVLMHNGSNTMWFCVTWLAPEKDFAVLVTCNRGGPPAEQGCDAAAGALIQHFQQAGNSPPTPTTRPAAPASQAVH